MYYIIYNLNNKRYAIMTDDDAPVFPSVFLSTEQSGDKIFYIKGLNNLIKFISVLDNGIKNHILSINKKYFWLYLPIKKLTDTYFIVKDYSKKDINFKVLFKSHDLKEILKTLIRIRNNKKQYSNFKNMLDNLSRIARI